ncbi:hypothetical protein PGTUg99_037259 [Puccinia graminis f. sp. tritici]|uniref:Uncharacterized protein n=1 Tax=Puccinia graminis f. sp. tritici TaxID=56615 RepID=A0A5B0PSI4_PUCGR|nr:hypothetical protein PGTUg99_037259 [Puccinia graminis f. sp. tritici]
MRQRNPNGCLCPIGVQLHCCQLCGIYAWVPYQDCPLENHLRPLPLYATVSDIGVITQETPIVETVGIASVSVAKSARAKDFSREIQPHRAELESSQTSSRLRFELTVARSSNGMFSFSSSLLFQTRPNSLRSNSLLAQNHKPPGNQTTSLTLLTFGYKNRLDALSQRLCNSL